MFASRKFRTFTSYTSQCCNSVSVIQKKLVLVVLKDLFFNFKIIIFAIISPLPCWNSTNVIDIRKLITVYELHHFKKHEFESEYYSIKQECRGISGCRKRKLNNTFLLKDKSNITNRYPVSRGTLRIYIKSCG